MKKKLRVIVYGILLIFAFVTAYLYGRNEVTREREQALQVLKREINSSWGLTKIEIDMLNESTQSYIDRRKLKPGEKLPPSELAKENPVLREMLKKMKTFYYIKSFPATSGEYSTKATAIIAINNKVPKEGEKYAYGAIEHNYEIFGSTYSIYPQDGFAISIIRRALKAYAKTLDGEKE
jgi:hypothetical protein